MSSLHAPDQMLRHDAADVRRGHQDFVSSLSGPVPGSLLDAQPAQGSSVRRVPLQKHSHHERKSASNQRKRYSKS